MAYKVQIGIIGVGQIGKNHLRRYADMADVEVVAAADLNADEIEAESVSKALDI